MLRIAIPALLLAACEFEGVREDPVWTANITVSRERGMVNKYFSAQVSTYSNYVKTVEYMITGTLPPGISFDASTGMLQGTPTQAGFYTIKIWARDRDRGTHDDPDKTGNRWYTRQIELKMFDKLEGE
jgi:hypothetical protein